MSDANKRARELHERANAGDTGAARELREMVWVPLVACLGRMTAGLCGIANLFDAATGLPHAPGTLGDIVSRALDDAISKWDGKGNWVQFATSFVVAALWDAVTTGTGLPARDVGRAVPGGSRSPAAVCSGLMRARPADLANLIRLAAVASWRDAGRNRRGWLLLLQKLGDALLSALEAVLVAAGIDWRLALSVKETIWGLAKAKARRGGGPINRKLAFELFNAAMIAIAFACRTYDPAKKFLPFAGKVAHHAMLEILDLVRADDDEATWLRILAAIDALRDILKEEPTIRQIVDYLNARNAGEIPKHAAEDSGVADDGDLQTAPSKPKRRKYSVRRVRNLMVVFGLNLDRDRRRKTRGIADGSAMATAGAEALPTADEPLPDPDGPRDAEGMPMGAEEVPGPPGGESMEERFDRASLSPLERQVVRLRRDDVSYPEIAAQTGISESDSKRIFGEAVEKLAAVAELITPDESSVLFGKFVALKEGRDIAKALGVHEDRVEALLDRARWKLRVYPGLWAESSEAERCALELAWSGMSHGQIAIHLQRPLPDVTSLLTHAVAKVSPHHRGNNHTIL